MTENPYRNREPIELFRDAYFLYVKSPFSEFTLSRIRHGDTVLELGAGTGKLSIQVAARIPDTQVMAIDIDPEAQNYQSRLLRVFEASVNGRLMNLNFKRGDLFDSGLRHESSDVVFSEGVVEHWSDEKRQRCINIHADLAKRCVLIITTNGNDSEATAKAASSKQSYVGMEDYERPYTKSELKAKMEVAGLTKVCVWESKELDFPTNEYLLAEGFK